MSILNFVGSMLVILFLVQNLYGKAEPKNLTYCVSAKSIDFNSNRKIEDGKDLSYLMLLKSYISTDKGVDGLLEAYEFSPDGKIFTGRVSESALWPDGAKLLPQEASAGIVNGLPFRILGERVIVKKSEVLDSKTFRIYFESQILNLTGVMREALSTNSRHNRFWPIKINPKNEKHEIMVIGKIPIQFRDGKYELDLDQYQVTMRNDIQVCKSNYTVFSELIMGKAQNYNLMRSTSPGEVIGEMNSVTLSYLYRVALGSAIRLAFSQISKEQGFELNQSFFEAGEIGHRESLKWDKEIDFSRLKNRNFVIAYEVPILKTLMPEKLNAMGIRTTSISVPFRSEKVDVQILAAGMQHGRHIILQDLLRWPHVSDFMINAPLTKAHLKKIAKFSASTLPPDEMLLTAFESATVKEYDLFPMGRRFAIAYNLRSSPQFLTWSESGELAFERQDKFK